MVKVLRKIVNTEDGTAKLANVKNYQIAGKTGTANQSANGGYSRAKINTFASIFHLPSPKYVFIVMLDTPKTSSSYIYNYRHKEELKLKVLHIIQQDGHRLKWLER